MTPLSFEEWKRIHITEPAAFNRRMEALNKKWYDEGKYEKWGCDAFGVSFVLVSSEADDKRFETEADYQHSKGEWRGV